MTILLHQNRSAWRRRGSEVGTFKRFIIIRYIIETMKSLSKTALNNQRIIVTNRVSATRRLNYAQQLDGYEPRRRTWLGECHEQWMHAILHVHARELWRQYSMHKLVHRRLNRLKQPHLSNVCSTTGKLMPAMWILAVSYTHLTLPTILRV